MRKFTLSLYYTFSWPLPFLDPFPIQHQHIKLESMSYNNITISISLLWSTRIVMAVIRLSSAHHTSPESSSGYYHWLDPQSGSISVWDWVFRCVLCDWRVARGWVASGWVARWVANWMVAGCNRLLCLLCCPTWLFPPAVCPPPSQFQFPLCALLSWPVLADVTQSWNWEEFHSIPSSHCLSRGLLNVFSAFMSKC